MSEIPGDVKKEDLLNSEKSLPKHVAIIMDGNGRWAKKRGLPRVVGHEAGVKALKKIIHFSITKGIQVLTVYAFSSENWKRPPMEISRLLALLNRALQKHFMDLHDNNVKLRFIGALSSFPSELRRAITDVQNTTVDNTGLELVIALNYGGRWDITNAFIELNKSIAEHRIKPEDIDESLISKFICLSDLPYPDLFIRTGGEKRISNYLLWQLAYTELYFDDCLWPNFAVDNLQQALTWYAGRQRRFGCTSEQVEHA